MQNYIKYLKFVVILTFGVFASFCDSFAASISEQQKLNFGVATAPTSGRGRITINPNGDVTNNQKTTIFTPANRGEYIITVDDPDKEVSFDIVNISSSSSEVEVDRMKIRFKNKTYKWTAFPTPYVEVGSLSEPVYVGGRIRFTKNSPGGVNDFTFDLVVTEQ